MIDNPNSKCPYCGSGLIVEEDGYRCRLCKSFFPFEEEPQEDPDDPNRFSLLEARKRAIEEKTKTETDKEFARTRMRNELIGLAAAFVSAACLFFSKTLKMPYLMIPGFVLWAFSAGFTAWQYFKAKKNGRKAAWIRIALLLFVAILVVLFVHPIE